MNLAIDLGTSNIRIYSDKKGKILDEPSVVTIDADTGSILALGTEAAKMIGRTSKRIKAMYKEDHKERLTRADIQKRLQGKKSDIILLVLVYIVPVALLVMGYPAEDATPLDMHGSYRPMEETVIYK